jgi:hypothetical protein
LCSLKNKEKIKAKNITTICTKTTALKEIIATKPEIKAQIASENLSKLSYIQFIF